ncbi:MAG: diaminopimelate epimerase, partial [Clostridia bacterium]|nr:diaminopimelate epimerase [Clostridia bacterium]
MKFTKMHGIGNDYVYVNTMEETVTDPVSLSVAVSDRHKGIGSDGLILIGRDDDGMFTMDIYNADGSRGMMCGNGIRCVAKYLYDNGFVTGSEVSIRTASGVKQISMITEDGRMTKARVDMGAPTFEHGSVPYDPAFVRDGKLEVNGQEV